MFGLFKRRPKPTASVASGVYVTAQLNARLQPLDRSYFEDPLDEFLKQAGLGEVTGGGTLQAPEPAGIAHSDIEICLEDASSSTIAAIIKVLEARGAPKGSIIFHDRMPDAIARAEADGSKVELDRRGSTLFGAYEGMAIFLNGVDLPAEVYASSDVNALIAEVDKLLGDDGKYLSYWQGSRETGLYFYGPSFERMRAATAPLLERHPLCQLARVEQIA